MARLSTIKKGVRFRFDANGFEYIYLGKKRLYDYNGKFIRWAYSFKATHYKNESGYSSIDKEVITKLKKYYEI